MPSNNSMVCAIDFAPERKSASRFLFQCLDAYTQTRTNNRSNYLYFYIYSSDKQWNEWWYKNNNWIDSLFFSRNDMNFEHEQHYSNNMSTNYLSFATWCIYIYAANGAHFICHIRLLYVNSIAQIIKNTCSCSYIFGSSDYICRMWVWRRTLNVPVCVGHSHSCYIQLMETSSHHQNVKRMPKFTNPIIVLFVSIFSTFRTISHWYIDLYLISRIVEFSVHRKKKKTLNMFIGSILRVSVQLYMQIRPHQPRKTPSNDDMRQQQQQQRSSHKS